MSRGIACLADIEALEAEAPLAQRLPARTVWGLIERAAARFGSRPAISFLPNGLPDDEVTTWSHAALLGAARQVANALHALGLQPEDGVGILLPNLPQTYFSILGTQALGHACPISPLQGPDQVARILTASRCRALIAPGPALSPTLWARAQAAVAGAPGVRHLIALGAPDGAAPAGSVQVHDFDRLCALQPADRLRFEPEKDADALAACFHTGGTTGAPKVARHSQRNQVYEAWAFSHLAALSQDDVCLLGLPLFHVHAVIPASLSPLSVGAHVVMLGAEGYRGAGVLAGFWRTVTRFAATAFNAVPSVYAALLNVDTQGARLDSLRFAICGSAPLPVALFEAFERHTGLRILEGYGLTEGTCVSSVNPPQGERRIGSIGLRYPYQAMKTACLDEQGRWLRDCAVDELGAVLISGPNVFAGYTDDALTAEAFAAPGWLNTGDLGRQDAQGYFWLTGRAKDMIKRSGHSIDPKAVEEVLHAHPAVAAAAVVGRPDPQAGELPVAFVSLHPGAQATPDTLLGHCRQRLGDPVAQPVALTVLPALPLTPVGKLDKLRLRAMAGAQADPAAPASVPPHHSSQETSMIRVTVSYAGAAGQRFDHAYYQSHHRALIQRLLGQHGLQRVEMDQCLADGAGGPPPVVAAAHLLFDTLAGFQAGMAAHGAALMQDIAHYTDLAPNVLVSETTR
ncbi:acyl-CoA synthetase [Aquabacterium sp.]|uniref:acyl-CoA synthetase n=1 Tax=Aquabacterium sp. TaxID=1872578 RepID=UPI003784E8E8